MSDLANPCFRFQDRRLQPLTHLRVRSINSLPVLSEPRRSGNSTIRQIVSSRKRAEFTACPDCARAVRRPPACLLGVFRAESSESSPKQLEGYCRILIKYEEISSKRGNSMSNERENNPQHGGNPQHGSHEQQGGHPQQGQPGNKPGQGQQGQQGGQGGQRGSEHQGGSQKK